MSAHDDQEGGVAVLLVSIAFVVGGGLGYMTSGLVSAVSWGTGVALVSGTILAVVRYRRNRDSLLERPAPELRGLPPEQAMAVLAAASGGVPVRSAILDALEEIARDHPAPADALPRVEQLRTRYPRNPAVTARLAVLQHALGQTERASSTVTEAITLALDGGMNPSAASIFLDYPGERTDLSLPDDAWSRLAGALDAAHAPDAAAYCRERIGSS